MAQHHVAHTNQGQGGEQTLTPIIQLRNEGLDVNADTLSMEACVAQFSYETLAIVPQKPSWTTS